VPEQLFDLVMTPIMFTLLFTFVFGGALAGSPRDYLQLFLPGILVQTVVFNSVYSGMGLSTDMGKGLFDRFRSLPIWSLAPFAGLMVGDVLRHLIAGGIILTIGLILGYRPEAGILGVLASFAMLLTVGFGMGWIFIVLGLLIRTPMTVMTIGFSFLFPLVFASNIMVDPKTMPSWLRAFVEVNPVSLMTTALRGLMGGTATIEQIGLALIAPVAITILLAPVTIWLYRKQ
jgi:ABC-2 type transport system permease protein